MFPTSSLSGSVTIPSPVFRMIIMHGLDRQAYLDGLTCGHGSLVPVSGSAMLWQTGLAWKSAVLWRVPGACGRVAWTGRELTSNVVATCIRR